MKKKVIFYITAVTLCAVFFVACSKMNINAPSAEESISSIETGDSLHGLIPPAAGVETLWGDTLDEPGEVITGDGGLHDYIKGSIGCAWGSTIFYSMDGRNIKYQNVNNVQENGLMLYNDVLANGGNDPFARIDRALMLIDEKATMENNGFPVLLIATTYYQPAEDADGEPFLIYETQIGSFNTLTNKWTVIKSDPGELIMQLSLYKDTILFVTFSGEDEGYSLHKMNRDGNGYVKMENEETAMITLGYVHDDIIYYVDEKTYSLYSCELDFSKKKQLFSELNINIKHVDDEFIYYEAYREGGDTQSRYLACRNINNLSEIEFIFEQVSGVFFENTYFYLDDNNGGSDVLYAYNFDSDETEIIFDIRDYNANNNSKNEIYKYQFIISNKYIICDIVYFHNESRNHLTCTDLTSGAEWKIPY